MDDKCLVERLLREGIFVSTGDIIIFAGSSDYFGAYAQWNFGTYDIYVVLDLINYFGLGNGLDNNCTTELDNNGNDLVVPDALNCDYIESLAVFEAVASGRTIIEANFTVGQLELEDFYFDIYVDQYPCLCATCPRECVPDCYDDEDYATCY